ncbi:MAG: ABC transporter ATP-binding protein [Sulfuritalea sp.]|nr:ABC transporter ATP-binding protein [Sulfuritalea sp.]
MSDTVIDIDEVGKRYALSHQHRPDSLKAWLRSTAKRVTSKTEAPTDEEFWALKDVSLQVKQGECLALVGKNGSGKSTLLKMISRVTPPTRGRIRVRGRVAALLEVGTGFHPELTGRENVFLNGAMLGCPEQELRRRFDAIVEFSGVERFLDTPVKHYSSGMYVRLAYAVAAHVDSDVQIIDEVLAVGDAEFKKKCIDNLLHQRSIGKTVIFVTHNEDLIATLATRIVELSQGELIA